MSNVQSIIKNIQKIMWQDKGVNGDAIRIEQLVWMLFLKIFDDRERNLELINPKYKSPIPEKFRYRNWALDEEGITGEDLFNFVDNELFPALKNLEISLNDTNGFIVKSIFSDTNNYMKNGTLIKKVFNRINEINFNKTNDRHDFGDIYEGLLKDLQSAGKAGEFYTPRPLTRFVVEMVNPKLGEKVLDPACGTGGFIVNALEHMRKDVKTADDEKKLQSSIHGVEFKPLPHMLAITNMMLHNAERRDLISLDDMLSHSYTEYGPNSRVDVILANPPFGASVVDGTEANFPAQYRTKATEDLFLFLFTHLLKDGGRAGIVLPDSLLTGEGVKTKIKEKLLTECNLHTIIRLPPGVFSPYAIVNTNLLFFTKGEPTKKIWYYQMQLPAGFSTYTKTKPIKDSEFELIKKWWHNRDLNKTKNAWSVSIEDVVNKKYNLDFKNPNIDTSPKNISSENLTMTILNREEEIKKIIVDAEKIISQNINKIIKNSNNKWDKKAFDEVLDYEQPTEYIVGSTNYNNTNKIPVLTAGKKFILGYTDEKNNIFPTNKLPVIIFDDFTTATKFVDFPFKVKSSAMKILHKKDDNVDVKYLFYFMQTIKHNHNTHKRYWISEYSKIKIPIPPLSEQKKIVESLDILSKKLNLSEKIKVLQELQKSQLEDFKRIEKTYLFEAFNGEVS
jgi:type I restriction enzyme M protein